MQQADGLVPAFCGLAILARDQADEMPVRTLQFFAFHNLTALFRIFLYPDVLIVHQRASLSSWNQPIWRISWSPGYRPAVVVGSCLHYPICSARIRAMADSANPASQVPSR
jgi:hypothetical protein